MTWVKVCGVGRRADIEAARAADAVGFVLAESPRRLAPEAVARLVPFCAGLETFLVTVDATATELLDLASYCGVTGVQPHGRHAGEAAAAARMAGLTVLRPVKVNGTVSLDGIPSDQVPLLDTAHPHQEGGTGTAFDWPVASGLDRKVVVAGGLGPGTVGDAIRALRPWGVDASSRLESAPGVKDADLIERYVAEAKGA